MEAADIVNQGLRAGGVPLRIGELYEGSEAARTALEIYSQARDEIIDSGDWAFTRRATTALTLLKGPPPDGGYSSGQPWSSIYPAPGFLFEYLYPDDCIDLRAIIGPPSLMPDLDPLPALWRIDNDPFPIVAGDPPVSSGPQAKVILCNMANAIGVYRARITDPAEWEPGFIAALVAALGKKFAVAFGVAADAQKELTAEQITTAQVGPMERG